MANVMLNGIATVSSSQQDCSRILPILSVFEYVVIEPSREAEKTDPDPERSWLLRNLSVIVHRCTGWESFTCW